MIARRLGLGTLGVLCALTGAVVFGVSGASAAVTHEFLPGVSAKLNEGVPAVGPHGETVPAAGRFGSDGLVRISMTVDSGELYVADGSVASRIDRFDASSGAFLAQLPQVS